MEGSLLMNICCTSPPTSHNLLSPQTSRSAGERIPLSCTYPSVHSTGIMHLVPNLIPQLPWDDELGMAPLYHPSWRTCGTAHHQSVLGTPSTASNARLLGLRLQFQANCLTPLSNHFITGPISRSSICFFLKSCIEYGNAHSFSQRVPAVPLASQDCWVMLWCPPQPLELLCLP